MINKVWYEVGKDKVEEGTLYLLWYELYYGSYYDMGWYGLELSEEDDTKSHWHNQNNEHISEPTHYAKLFLPPHHKAARIIITDKNNINL